VEGGLHKAKFPVYKASTKIISRKTPQNPCTRSHWINIMSNILKIYLLGAVEKDMSLKENKEGILLVVYSLSRCCSIGNSRKWWFSD
jgi:hypothetical protein